MTGRIHLKNMVFYGYHGALAEENALGQKFLIDLHLTLDISEAVATDHLDATVDYVNIYSVCRRIVEHDRVKLLETLANDLLDAVLDAAPRVTDAAITIRKPSVPLGGAIDYVALETSKKREHRLPRPGK